MDLYTGGYFETNAFLLPEGILIDAPEGAAAWLRKKGVHLKTLLLTHGHIDHLWDAAEIEQEHQCQVLFHHETLPMAQDGDFFKKFGMPWSHRALAGGEVIPGDAPSTINGISFHCAYVPGHCPGSLCFIRHDSKEIFGGDVLFAGGVGRWDLPGGDRDLLISGIHQKLYTLPDDYKVHPGHGPSTTIGTERRSNPYT